jgi:hypothetical protein
MLNDCWDVFHISAGRGIRSGSGKATDSRYSSTQATTQTSQHRSI